MGVTKLTGFPDIDEFMLDTGSKVVKVWKDEVATYFLVERDWLNLAGEATIYYCGYAIFTDPPLLSDGYQDVEDAYVHGGVTYGKRYDSGIQVYGFDCAHYGDEDDPRCKDYNWLSSQCEKMARDIIEIGKRITRETNDIELDDKEIF